MKNKIWTLLAASAICVAGSQFALAAFAEDGAQPAAPDGAAAQPTDAEKKLLEAEMKLLEVGKVAPDFTLPLIGGGDVTLGNLLKFNKAVIVSFWGIESENGGPQMVKLQKLHEELESKGVATVAVNPIEDASDVERFVRQKKIGYQVCVDGKETNRAVTHVFKAKTLPVFYVLDPAGKVLWRGIGFKEPALRETLAKAGVK